MVCIKCNKSTNNLKFCSRSCSVSYNNTIKSKRQRFDRICIRCGINLGSTHTSRPIRTLCLSCKKVSPLPRIETQTLSEVRGTGNAVFGGRYANIRAHSRKSYIVSGGIMSCKICGYSNHVDICHIKDIKCFPETALISEINHISNLVALCKNHHWEFDKNKSILEV